MKNASSYKQSRILRCIGAGPRCLDSLASYVLLRVVPFSLVVFVSIHVCPSANSQETDRYIDVLTGREVKIYPEVDEEAEAPDVQIVLHNFLFFPSTAQEPLDLESDEFFREAALLQSRYLDEKEGWSKFAKLIHFVPLTDEQRKKNSKEMEEIQKWARRHNAVTVDVPNTDRLIAVEVGGSGLPLVHLSLYERNGERLLKPKTADPRNKLTDTLADTLADTLFELMRENFAHEFEIDPRTAGPPKRSGGTVDEALFQLMREHFTQNFKIDEKQDWVAWLSYMEKVLPTVDLFDSYVELGVNRLKRVYEGADYTKLPICAEPPDLSESNSNRIEMAIRGFEGAIKTRRDQAHVQNYLGIAHFRKRSYSDALSYFKKADELTEGNEPTYRHNLIVADVMGQKALVHNRQEKQDKAEEEKLRAALSAKYSSEKYSSDGMAKSILADCFPQEIPRPPIGPVERVYGTLNGMLFLAGLVALLPALNGFSPPLAPDVSPVGLNPLTADEFNELTEFWREHEAASARSLMVRITVANLLLSPPVVNSKTGAFIVHATKFLSFAGLAFYEEIQVRSARSNRTTAKRRDVELFFYGRERQAIERRNWFLSNAGIDLVNVVLMGWQLRSSDGTSMLGAEVRENGYTNPDILISFRKIF